MLTKGKKRSKRKKRKRKRKRNRKSKESILRIRYSKFAATRNLQAW